MWSYLPILSILHCKRSALSFAEHGLGYDLRIELFPDWQLLCIWLVLSLINADLMTSFTTAVSETILAFWREITSTEFSLCFLCIIQQYDELEKYPRVSRGFQVFPLISHTFLRFPMLSRDFSCIFSLRADGLSLWHQIWLSVFSYHYLDNHWF